MVAVLLDTHLFPHSHVKKVYPKKSVHNFEEFMYMYLDYLCIILPKVRLFITFSKFMRQWSDIPL
jgi:hypothetical protein